MTVYKLISHEATPIFFRETSFYVEKCECWSVRESEMDTSLSPIENLIIAKDMSDSFLDRHEGIGAVLGWLKPTRRWGRNTRNSLVCQPIIHEDEDFSVHNGGLRWELGVLINEMPECFRRVEFTFCADLTFETKPRFFVQVMAEGDGRKISIRSAKQEEARTTAGIFAKYGHEFKSFEWIPDTSGTSTKGEICNGD